MKRDRHMKSLLKGIILGTMLLAAGNLCHAGDYVAIDEHLGSYLPKNLRFTTEEGKQVRLLDIINMPTVISPVYYNCPGLCTPVMDGIVKLLNRTDLEIGKDFEVINISFHEAETPELARTKKGNYTSLMENENSSDHWHFLTGDKQNIGTLLDTLGYSVIRKGEDILHPAAIMIVSPNGKIVKYIHGTKYNPVEFKMAVQDAAAEKIVPTITRLVKMCFSFEPEGRDKQKSVTIIGFILTLCIGLVIIFIYPPLRNKT
jgi:protein SCO1/2